MSKKSEVDKSVHNSQVRALFAFGQQWLVSTVTTLSALAFHQSIGLPHGDPRRLLKLTSRQVAHRAVRFVSKAVFAVGGGGRDGALTMVRVGAETDVTVPGDGGESVGESGEAWVPVEKLPLESKVKEMTEQRLRLRLRMEKKICFRKKRLVRKRRLRKKGRWPPSKLKNV